MPLTRSYSSHKLTNQHNPIFFILCPTYRSLFSCISFLSLTTITYIIYLYTNNYKWKYNLLKVRLHKSTSNKGLFIGLNFLAHHTFCGIFYFVIFNMHAQLVFKDAFPPFIFLFGWRLVNLNLVFVFLI